MIDIWINILLIKLNKMSKKAGKKGGKDDGGEAEKEKISVLQHKMHAL